MPSVHHWVQACVRESESSSMFETEHDIEKDGKNIPRINIARDAAWNVGESATKTGVTRGLDSRNGREEKYVQNRIQPAHVPR